MGFIFQKKDPTKTWGHREGHPNEKGTIELVVIKYKAAEKNEDWACSTFYQPFMTEKMKEDRDRDEQQRNMESMGFGGRGGLRMNFRFMMM